MKSIYEFKEYKKYLDYRVNKIGERGSITKLAEATSSQRSYLSKVLNAEVHLTMDQAFRACKHWQLSQQERAYFMLLVEKDRAGDKDYKDHLVFKINRLRKKHQDLSTRVKDRMKIEEDNSKFLALYYSSWVYSAAHMLTSIPEYQSISKMKERLNVPEESLRPILTHLSESNYITKKQSKWQFYSGENHLSKSSPLLGAHLNNWRSRALINAQNFQNEDLHFSLVQSLSEKDREKLKNMILNFLDEFAETANPSRPEDLICLNIDFFKV